MTMTCTTPTPSAGHQAGVVLDLTAALAAELGEHTPAGATETLVPDLAGASWLLADSSVMANQDTILSLRMLLERAPSQGVALALDLNWQPRHWSLPPESPPRRRCCGDCTR